MIPFSHKLSTYCLSRIFDNTAATYKYYWFLCLLDFYVIKGLTRIKLWDILVEMVAKAWYPVTYFRLSFGKSESLYEAIWNLQKGNNIPININSDELLALLHEYIQSPSKRKQLDFLKMNVPFRFLRPWIDTSDNNLMAKRSELFENGCLYKLERVGREWWIEFNTEWLPYLKDNYSILCDFTYWNLTQFLQVRNPNVPNIASKLIKSNTRSSLAKQHSFWNEVILKGNHINCPYTGEMLSIGKYELDHFMPWSFVSHDLLWNLIPCNPSINSSKSNKLPNLTIYLPKLAQAHQNALKIYMGSGKERKILEDYLILGCTPQELVEMNQYQLNNCFAQTFTPLYQIAFNMGFETWSYD